MHLHLSSPSKLCPWLGWARAAPAAGQVTMKKSFPIQKSEEEWKKELTPTQYAVLREKGTERAFTGELWDHHEKGKYRCAGCGAELFESETKFDSGCGWPSFYEPNEGQKGEVVVEETDTSLGMKRTEVM